MRLRPPAPHRAETGEGVSNEHQSLALKYLVEGLLKKERTPRPRVLDLGPAVSRNVDFFTGRSCGLHIADLHQSLFSRSLFLGAEPPSLSPRAAAAAGASGNEEFDRILADELPPRGGQLFDLILVWDLFNYLTPERVRLLGWRLAPLCGRGSILFSVISTRPEIPDRPVTFEILDGEHIRYDVETPLKRSSPRYKEPEIQRCLAGFGIESTFLLRNGMQEYLFTPAN